MSQMRYTIQSGPKSLLGQVVGFIVGLVVLVVSVVVGAFFLAAILGGVLIMAGIIGLRMWWLRRQLGAQAESEYIEAEYRVVDRHKRD